MFPVPRITLPGLAALLSLLLAQYASAECFLGEPIVSPTPAYDPAIGGEQTVTVPVTCDTATPVLLRLAAPGGSYDSVRQRYNAALNTPDNQRLNVYVPDAAIFVSNTPTVVQPDVPFSVQFRIVIPPQQWGAPKQNDYASAFQVSVIY